MTDAKHHKDLMEEISGQLKPIFDKSSQPVYIFLDDQHKACNKKFSSMLGYSSPKEFADVKQSFTKTFVEAESQVLLVRTYQNTLESLSGSVIEVVWKKKTGELVKTKLIMVPIMLKGHFLALHFIYAKE